MLHSSAAETLISPPYPHGPPLLVPNSHWAAIEVLSHPIPLVLFLQPFPLSRSCKTPDLELHLFWCTTLPLSKVTTKSRFIHPRSTLGFSKLTLFQQNQTWRIS